METKYLINNSVIMEHTKILGKREKQTLILIIKELCLGLSLGGC